MIGKKNAMAILAANDLSRAWELFEDKNGSGYSFMVLRDIVGKLVKYGSISDKAINYVRILVEKIDGRAELEAKWAEEKADAADCPEGRVEISGEVLKVEWRESRFGGAWKMTVKTDDGWLCWGTVPSGLRDSYEGCKAERGDRVTFTGTLTPSDTDSKFGFFKRPSGGELTKSESAAA